MKVIIIGAGEQGYVLTWKLASNPAVDEIVVADSDEKRAQDVATRVGAGKAVAALVDALDVEQVAAIAIGAERPRASSGHRSRLWRCSSTSGRSRRWRLHP